MGHNISKSKFGDNYDCSNQRGRNFQYPAKTSNYRNRKYSRTRGSAHRSALQEEYNAWLQSLSLEDEEYQQTSTSVWTQRQRNPWHATLQKKITSLLSSKKHRDDPIVWPKYHQSNALKRNHPPIDPPKIQLAFTNEYPENLKHRSKRLQTNKRNNRNLKSNEVHRQSRSQTRIYPQETLVLENRYSPRLSPHSNYGTGSSHSSNFDLAEHSKHKHRSKLFCSHSSLKEDPHSSPMSSSERSKKLRNSFDQKLHPMQERKYKWEVPCDYNAIQGSSSLIGPRVLPYEVPKEIRNLSTTALDVPVIRKTRRKKFTSKNKQQINSKVQSMVDDMENFYRMTCSFQTAGVDEEIIESDQTLSRNTSPSCLTISSDPKIESIITEVGEDFMNRFSKKANLLPNWQDSGLISDPSSSFREFSGEVESRHMNNIIYVEEESTPNSFCRKTKPSDIESLTDDIKIKSSESNIQLPKSDIISGRENFFLARTNELSTKKINEELNKLGYGNVIKELSNFQSDQVNNDSLSPPSGSIHSSSMLWRSDNSMVNTLNSLKEQNSPYSQSSPVKNKTNSQCSGHLSVSSEDILYFDYREDKSAPGVRGSDSNKKIAPDHMKQRAYVSGGPPLTSGSESESSEDLFYHCSSRNKNKSKQTQSSTNFNRIDRSLESKIDSMVKSTIGKRLQSQTSLELQRQRKKKKRHSKNRKSEVSLEQIEKIIENQLASALTSIMLPRK